MAPLHYSFQYCFIRWWILAIAIGTTICKNFENGFRSDNLLFFLSLSLSFSLPLTHSFMYVALCFSTIFFSFSHSHLLFNECIMRFNQGLFLCMAQACIKLTIAIFDLFKPICRINDMVVQK